MHSVSNIRESFLDFFKENEHEVLPSSSLVPHNDPTLMFTNAGMVQFKNVFSGAESLTNASGDEIKRATTSQKCVRAGGKHNDLDNVGYTARHHTFFEMLGNFSFGNYFKDGAIELAWDFLTKTLELPKDKLLVTVYHDDDEAFDLWKKISGFADEKIIRIATSDNFWAMGDTGPCGPCSEIFYDHGEEIAGGPPGSPDEDGDRFVEIWNLVFMQYEQLAGKDGEKGKRIDLPKPCIDTGMGLERMAAIMQGEHDNYDTDLFKNLIAASEEISGNNDAKLITSHRVIADHLRSSCFLLADGVMPSNEGRGYVLRRIMRRAMRHAHILGCADPLMFKLVPSLVKEMGKAFPELNRAEALITETLKLEEERFKETLDKGLKLLDSESSSLKKGDSLDGKVAFKLYDTYGFPVDLTEDILRSRDIGIDQAGFDKEMDEQKARARAAWSGSGEKVEDEIWFKIREEKGPTEFLGYKTSEGSGEVIAIVKDGKDQDKASKGDKIAIITNQTPFYAESGGQAGDYGTISKDGLLIEITDTKKQLGDLHIHLGEVKEGEVKIGEVVDMNVSDSRRDSLRANHSATHLLHAALRRQLGDHVVQKGSLVEADYFRFDFSHSKALEPSEIDSLEDEVNNLVRQNTDVGTRLMTPDEAIEKGALALFGEKYGDEVRVVNMGKSGKEDFSVELCGGTHVRRTGDIGLFKIIKESAVASGIRRIEAVTGKSALEYVRNRDQVINNLAGLLKSSPEELPNRISSLLEERKNLERDLKDSRKKNLVSGDSKKGGDEPEEIAGVKFVSKVLSGVPAKDLRGIVDDFKNNLGSGVVVIIADNDGKASIVVGVTSDITDNISAVDLVRKGSEILGGSGGGGRPDFAQAGGPDATKAEDAISAIKSSLSS